MFFEIYGAASLPLNIQASKIETIYYDSLIITINLKVTTWSIIVNFFSESFNLRWLYRPILPLTSYGYRKPGFCFRYSYTVYGARKCYGICYCQKSYSVVWAYVIVLSPLGRITFRWNKNSYKILIICIPSSVCLRLVLFSV